MSDERPEALLKSALEKIVYFEARSGQLVNDLEQARQDALRLRAELAAAAQREIDLRGLVAELEVRAQRLHSEREESGRAVEALRHERADLIGKILEASRISRAGEEPSLDELDLAAFIADLRAEVIAHRQAAPRDGAGAGEGVVAQAAAVARTAGAAPSALAASPAELQAFTVRRDAGGGRSSASVSAVAEGLRAEGRLDVSAADLASLAAPPRQRERGARIEETLFEASIRELAAHDAPTRLRAAERLLTLGQVAAVPALATALHGEQEPTVAVALLAALAELARGTGPGDGALSRQVQAQLVAASPDVRIAALRALLALDATEAGPHLAAALEDPDRAVRRRASLLVLALRGEAALQLGARAIEDDDARVRALAALVLGASGEARARTPLTAALRDGDAAVRRAASQALGRLLGRDVGGLVDLDEAQRVRAVRRLARLEAHPVCSSVDALERLGERLQPSGRGATGGASVTSAPSSNAPAAHPASRVPSSEGQGRHGPGAATPARHREAAAAATAAAPFGRAVALLELAPAATASSARAGIASPTPAERAERVLIELRSALRGLTLEVLAESAALSIDAAKAACAALIDEGFVLQRGRKYFVA